MLKVSIIGLASNVCRSVFVEAELINIRKSNSSRKCNSKKVSTIADNGILMVTRYCLSNWIQPENENRGKFVNLTEFVLLVQFSPLDRLTTRHYGIYSNLHLLN